MIAPATRADAVVLDAPSYLAYLAGVPLVTGVWRAGRPVALVVRVGV